MARIPVRSAKPIGALLETLRRLVDGTGQGWHVAKAPLADLLRQHGIEPRRLKPGPKPGPRARTLPLTVAQLDARPADTVRPVPVVPIAAAVLTPPPSPPVEPRYGPAGHDAVAIFLRGVARTERYKWGSGVY